jgi:hypothetical protein
MHLVFTLPGLLAPGAAGGHAATHLARVLAASAPPAFEPDGIGAALAARYGIARGRDWPLAAIRARALGVDTGGAYWLAADPVTLEAGRDDVRLVAAVRDLDAAEAGELVAALNAHFEGDGIAFVVARPDAWFVRAATEVALSTRPLAVVAGRMVRSLMPAGPDAGRWRRWQNEIEMLLHGHPVNAQRERSGKAPANGIWFSDGGALPERPANAGGIRTFADGGVAVALGAHAGSEARRLPASLDAALAHTADAETIVVAPAAPQDSGAIERAWAAPAWRALAGGRLATVTVIADGGDGAVAWTAHRPGVARRAALALAPPDLARLLSAARGPA